MVSGGCGTIGGYTDRPSSGSDARGGARGQEAVEIVVARTPNGPAPLLEGWSVLSSSERTRANRFAFEGDRCRFVAARALLKRLLAERLAASAHEVELAPGPFGKPALAGRFARHRVFFSLSHSQDLSLYAFSRECELGIDVEALRMVPDADDLASRFFSPGEKDVYLSLAADDRQLGFLSLWTRKEARLKALGWGLAALPGESETDPAPPSTSGAALVPGGLSVSTFFPRSGYVASLASRPH